MRKQWITALLSLSLFGIPVMTGCNEKVSEEKKVSTDPNTGKTTVDEKKTEKTPDGGTKKTEEHKTVNP